MFLHPATACAACASDLPYPAPMIEFMFETTRAVTHLIFSGTLARRLAAQIDATALIDADARVRILHTNATRLITRLRPV